jgi:hypothetical protein
LAAISKRGRKIGVLPQVIALSGNLGVTWMPPDAAVSREKDATVHAESEKLSAIGVNFWSARLALKQSAPRIGFEPSTRLLTAAC